MLKRISVILMLLAGTAATAFAAESYSAAQQDGKTVTGKVIDNAGEGVIGAGIVVVGTNNGTITDLDGTFTLKNVAEGDVIEIQCVGYRTVTVTYAGFPINVTLEEDSELLNEVVVTALGITREKKSLGYAVQDVKADELTKGGQASLTDALQGKVAGLQINAAGTGVGGSSKVVIRGYTSLADNNAPLWVIDGVPFDAAGSVDNGSYLWGGHDGGSAAFDINPEDIESVSVLKGPTAAALYGSRAGNGVILITTKKGGKNGKIGVSYSGKVSVSPIAYTLDLQDTYGQGLNGEAANQPYSWGAEIKGQSFPAWYKQGENTTYTLDKNPFKDFYKASALYSNNVTVQGGSSKNPFRITLGNDYNQGQVRGNSVNRTSVDVVSTYTLTDWLSFDIKANYIHSKGKNRQTLGLYGSSYFLGSLPRTIQTADLEEYVFDPSLPGQNVPFNWWGPNADFVNPYFIKLRDQNTDTKDRLFGMAAINIDLCKGLKLKIKEGLDYAGTEVRNDHPYKDNVFTQNPEVEISNTLSRELNSEFLLSYNNQWKDVTFGASVGGNIMSSKSTWLWGQGKQFISEGASFIGNGAVKDASNSVYEKQVNSLYAFANVGYKDMLFVDVTARNDWSSTLPANNRSYFYPSVAVSFLLTSALDAAGVTYNHDILDYAKVRASWARVGKDTDPYSLLDTFGTETHAFHLVYTYMGDNDARANANLKPEISDSFEVGTEWHFFKNRLGFDLTYYHNATKNQIMALSTPESTGMRSKLANVGQINNQGVELQINADFVRTRDFDFGANFNFAHNTSTVKALAPGIPQYSLGQLTGVSSTFQVIAREGEKLGELYDYGYMRNDKGQIIVDENGFPKRSDSQIVLGNIQPDLTGSVNLHLNYKGLFASALFNYQIGGQLFSISEYQAAKVGNAKRTENRADFVFEGVNENGAANTVKINAQDYWQNHLNVENFIYDASFLKLAELTVGYSFPTEMLERNTKGVVNSCKISLFGSNLAYLFKKTPGTTPDGSATSITMFASALDIMPLPNTRTFGVSLNIGF